MRVNTKGFTLVETLVSLASLLLFFGVVVTTFQLVTNLVGESRVRLVALSLTNEKIEAVRNLEFDDVGTVGGIPSGVLPQTETVDINGQEFTVKTSVVYIDDAFDGQLPDDLVSTDYKRVRIEVAWGGAFPSKNPVVQLTDVVPDGLESLAGGGTLYISVINASGVAVPNSEVTIRNSAVDPEIDLTINSDSQGRVILPGAPACNNCYQVAATKNNYSSDRTYSSSEVANPLKPDASVIEGELTSITMQIDQAVTINVLTTGPRYNNYQPFAGVQFKLTGNKIIGTNTLDEPIFKYDQNLSSGPGGVLVLSGLEWDTYSIDIPNPSSVDFAGSYPISPFALLPGANIGLTIVTSPATVNNLLVITQNISGQAVATASATIQRLGYIATASAGPLGKGDAGQVLFPGLTAGNYTLSVSQVGYKTATGSAMVNGDTKQQLILETL